MQYQKRLFILFLLLYFPLVRAEITSISDMESVITIINEAEKGTLGVFDIDMVLVQPSDPAFQMLNMKLHRALAKQILSEIPPEKKDTFLTLMTLTSESILVDPSTPLYLRQLSDKGISLMALTANLTGSFSHIQEMEIWKRDQLKQLGIEFSQSAPYPGCLDFTEMESYRGNYPTYLDGILYTNGSACSKGDVFAAFLDKTGLDFKKIIFIDDREECLKSLESVLNDRGIVFKGILYTGALDFPSEVISSQEFELKWKKLAATAKKI